MVHVLYFPLTIGMNEYFLDSLYGDLTLPGHHSTGTLHCLPYSSVNLVAGPFALIPVCPITCSP